MILFAAHLVQFALPQIPPEVWSLIIGVLVPVLLQYLNSRGVKLPLVKSFFDWLAKGHTPARPETIDLSALLPPPASVDPLPPVGQGAILELIRRAVREELRQAQAPAPPPP